MTDVADTPTDTAVDQDEIDDDEEESSQVTVPNGTAFPCHAQPNLEAVKDYREIGDDAICWRLSSAKPGNGVDQIRDPSHETYWQSDGATQPHWIQVHFSRRVALTHIAIYLDYKLDESYTPKQIKILSGVTTQDMEPALNPPNTTIEFNEPKGWCIVPLSTPPDPLDFSEEEQPYAKGFVFRIVIVSMHQNGRDTHVRNVKLFTSTPFSPHLVSIQPAIGAAATQDTMVTDTDDDDDDWNLQFSSMSFTNIR